MQGYNLNRRLTLETAVRSPDGAGGFTLSWSALGTLWGAVKNASARVGEGGGAALTTHSYRIYLRAAPQGSSMRPKPGQRFRDGTRLFLIDAVTEDDAEGFYLECRVHEEILS